MASRAYCFTLCNYTDEDRAHLARLPAPIRYICWGLEFTAGGVPHLQGYMELSKPSRLAGVKKLGTGFDRMHLEVRRGTRVQARTYCRKGRQSHAEWEELGEGGPNFGVDAEFAEHGDWEAGGQGVRPDLSHYRSMALTDGMRGVSATGNIQEIRVAEVFLTYHEEPRDWKPHVTWLWGPSGVGKSRQARVLLEHIDTYVKNGATKWWDGYDGHEGVIIDDFRDSWWCLTETLSLLDRYEKRVEVKGGFRQFKPKHVVVTSIHPPWEMYRLADEDAGQLLRRIDDVTKLRYEVGGGNTEPPLPPAENASATEATPPELSGDEIDAILDDLLGSPVSGRK